MLGSQRTEFGTSLRLRDRIDLLPVEFNLSEDTISGRLSAAVLFGVRRISSASSSYVAAFRNCLR